MQSDLSLLNTLPSALVGGADYCYVCVCVCVYLSVRPHAYLMNHMSQLLGVSNLPPPTMSVRSAHHI